MNQQPVINGLEFMYEKNNRRYYGATVTSRFVSKLQLKKGDVISLSASGNIKLGWMVSGGPSGVGGYEPYNLVSGFAHGCFMAGINGLYNYIGPGMFYRAIADGQLELAINDADYTNNKGYFDVVITQEIK
jgi:hypothetical protein